MIDLHFANLLGFCGFAISLSIALLEILNKEKNKSSYSLIFFSFNLALLQLRLQIFSTGKGYLYPGLLYFVIANIYLVGPIVLVIARNMLDFALPKNRFPIYTHFIIPALIALGEIVFHFQAEPFKTEILQVAFSQFRFDFLQIGIIIGVIYLISYLTYFLFKFLQIRSNYGVTYALPVLIILSVGFFTILGLAIGFVIKYYPLFHFGIFLSVVLSFLLLFYRENYPRFFETLKREIETKRYEKTQLNGLNLEAIQLRLKELMEESKLYRDEDIRLNDLADELLINPNQLSRILNEIFQKNFNEYINFYRVEEAKKILLEEKEKNVLNIAFDVGFNTKATFNSQFIKLTGMTPTEYRKKNGANK